MISSSSRGERSSSPLLSWMRCCGLLRLWTLCCGWVRQTEEAVQTKRALTADAHNKLLARSQLPNAGPQSHLITVHMRRAWPLSVPAQAGW